MKLAGKWTRIINGPKIDLIYYCKRMKFTNKRRKFSENNFQMKNCKSALSNQMSTRKHQIQLWDRHSKRVIMPSIRWWISQPVLRSFWRGKNWQNKLEMIRRLLTTTWDVWITINHHRRYKKSLGCQWCREIIRYQIRI